MTTQKDAYMCFCVVDNINQYIYMCLCKLQQKCYIYLCLYKKQNEIIWFVYCIYVLVNMTTK